MSDYGAQLLAMATQCSRNFYRRTAPWYKVDGPISESCHVSVKPGSDFVRALFACTTMVSTVHPPPSHRALFVAACSPLRLHVCLLSRCAYLHGCTFACCRGAFTVHGYAFACLPMLSLYDARPAWACCCSRRMKLLGSRPNKASRVIASTT